MKGKKFLQIMSVLIMVASLTGCEKYFMRVNLKRMTGNTVSLSERIVSVFDSEVRPLDDSLMSVPKLVVYIDSAECESCRVQKLYQYGRLAELSRSTRKYELFILFSPKQKGKEQFVKLLQHRDYPFPVYVDVENDFEKMNSFIPRNPRFHTFLVDRYNNPIIVGDPLAGEKMEELFMSVINSLD